MIKKMNLLAILLLSVMVMFTVSCEGPAGEDGAAGADGADGADGMDGVDANAFCVDCHSQANWDEITGLYAISGHANPGGLGYAGGRGGCARCHSAEGFEDYLAGYEGVDLPEKTALSCESCHGNHTTLEEGVAAPMATMEAIKLIVDETTMADFGDASNLCANCHNSRRNGSYYADVDSMDTDGDGVNDYDIHPDSVYISSTHAGPHYSAQVNTILGLGGYGTTTSTTHETVGCVSCHMGAATDTEGGHTFAPNLANCTEACHSAVAADFATWVEGKHDDTKARMEAVAAGLAAAGALIDNGDGTFSLTRVMVHKDVFEAFWNYRVMYQDHSYGVHNPGYYNTMLTTAETKLGL